MADRPSIRLDPLGSKLEPEVRAFAELLREYLDLTGTSLRATSKLCHVDQGTLSRYLSGARVPGWRFVEQFLGVAARQQGREPTREERLQAQELHQSALRVRGNTKWEVERLERELDEALEEQRYSAKREKLVTRELDARDERISQLEKQINDIQAQNRMLQGPGRADARPAIEHNKFDYQQILRERDELERNRKELIAQLAQVRAAKELAEHRCAQLARELDEAKAKLAAVEAMNGFTGEERDTDEENPAPPLEPDSVMTPRERKAVERALDRKTLQVHTGFVYVLSFVIAAFLGCVFSSVPSHSVLSAVSRWGLLVPVVLVLAATHERRPHGSWVRQLVGASMLIGMCFFAGSSTWPASW